MSKDIWRYLTGTTSAATILPDLAKTVCLANEYTEIDDSTGKVLRPMKPWQAKNWDIVFPLPNYDVLDIIDKSSLTADEFQRKILNQISLITDTVILKTTTTPKDITASVLNDVNVEDDLKVKSIDMYLELYKPTYLVNLENYSPDCERNGILPYLVTKSLYQQFTNPIGAVETDLKATYKTTPGMTVAMVDEVHAFPNYGNGRSSQDTKLAMFNEALKITDLTALVNTNITDMTVISANPDLLSFMESLTGMSESTLLSQTSIQVKTELFDYGNEVALTITCTRSYETYNIASGFDVALPEADKVIPSSIKFFIGTNEEPSTTWQYDTTSNTFKVVKTMNCITAVDGEPTIQYTYNKSSEEMGTIQAKKLLFNNHSIFSRIFDTIKPDLTGPVENIVDPITNEVSKMLAHTSVWSKLSWYQDFENIMIDTIDGGTSDDDITKGVVLLPIETTGLTSESKIKYWINVNNDRIILNLMGNPSLDYDENLHLLSPAYVGQIESFENSINDTAGNFALFTSSSTIPCLSQTVTKTMIIPTVKAIGVGDGTTNKFTLNLDANEFFEPDGVIEVITTASKLVTTITKSSGLVTDYNVANNIITVTVPVPPVAGADVSLSFSYYTSTLSTIPATQRDSFGNIVQVTYPDVWGINTATGVTDICMLYTTSKSFYQKHFLMFNTPEEYMQKRLYGQSAYTGEYFADTIKLVHGNDGVRGMLYDMLTIDSSSLNPFTELSSNKDFIDDPNAKEETYIYFPITALYNPFTTSPNATFGIAIKKGVRYPTTLSDQDIVQNDYDILDKYAGDITMITSNFYLPSVTEDGVVITWVSSDTTTIAITLKDGVYTCVVTRPVSGSGNKPVTITGTLTKGTVVMSKIYNVSVVEAGLSDLQAVTADKAWINIVNSDTITQNIILPTVGPNKTTIAWTSSDTTAISNTGVINRPLNGESDKTAVMTAVVTKGVATASVIINITILPYTDENNVDDDMALITWDSIRNTNLLKTSVVSDLNLYTKGLNGSTISWSSTNTTYISAAGTVTRPTYSNGDAIISLTAAVTRGTVTKSVYFLALDVVKIAITNTEVTTMVMAEITNASIKGTNADLLNVVSNLVLPKASSTIDLATGLCTWTEVDSSNKAITSDPYLSIIDSSSVYTGVVTRPASTAVNAPIILQLTVESKLASGVSSTATKNYNIIILHVA